MNYNTNYQIFDSSTRQVLFSNTNNSCFAEFSGALVDDKIKGFFVNRYMEVYHPLKLAKLKDESIFQYWVSILNRLGLKMTLEKRDYTDYKDTFPLKAFKEKNWVWTLNFKDYTSKSQLKLALHMLRYSYEYEMFEIILQFKEIADKYPNDDIFIIFIYSCLVLKKNYHTGHNVFFKGSNTKPISIEKLKEYYIKWSESKNPNNWDISSMVNENTAYDKNWIVRNNPTYEEYLEYHKEK